MTKKTPVDTLMRCSFCGKTQNDVNKLIAGPDVNICDGCVEGCVDIMFADTNPDGAVPHSPEAQRWQSVAVRLGRKPGSCSLCGGEAFSLLTIEGRGVLCGDCADAIEDALARGRPIR